MLLTIERVALLKSVPIFANTPGQVLASVAAILKEVVLEPGEPLLREGELGDCMYIIIEGRIRVHSDTRTIVELGPGRTVGELAVLDPEPRSASATAMEETRLFRIDKDVLDEVMDDRPEIAHAILRSLCRRIRETTVKS